MSEICQEDDVILQRTNIELIIRTVNVKAQHLNLVQCRILMGETKVHSPNIFYMREKFETN